MHWKTLKSEKVFETPYFQIHKDTCLKPDGDRAEYFVIDRMDVAIITAFTNKNELILIRQYRHPVRSISTEVPAGYLEANETKPEQAAARELLEETGYQAEKVIKLEESWVSSGMTNNKIHFHIGLNCQKIQEQNLDPNEHIEVLTTAWINSKSIIREQNIKEANSITALLLAEKYLEDHA